MPDTFQIYQSELTGPELDEALKNIALVQQSVADAAQSAAAAGESAADAAQAAQTAETYGAIVQQNQPAIQDIADNLSAVQGAAQNAQTAQSAATEAAASAQEAEQWAEQAQQVAQGAMGWYATPQALQAAHPTGQNGQWAIIGTTDTIWTWDSDTSAWVDSGSQVDLSNYYTKPQTNSLVSWQYTCIYDLDNWTASSSSDQANGYPWTQTVTLTPLNPEAPAITADSVFEPQIGCDGTGVADTDNALRAALAIIANGNSTSGAGTITTIVQSKPVVDIPVIFTLKTEVQ